MCHEKLTWWNRDLETAIQHVEKHHKDLLMKNPRIRVLTLLPSSVLFAFFSAAYGGPNGSFTSPVPIPLSECVSPDGEIFPSCWSDQAAPGWTEKDFQDDKLPIETY